MKRLMDAAAGLLLAGGLAACAAAPALPPADTGPRIHEVRVVSNGWHTAIVVARPDLVATGLLPEAGDFPEAAFLEFGWGDREYYPARNKTVGMTLRAALTPTPAVMHMAGLGRAPAPTGSGGKIVPLALTESGFRRLIRAIAGSFRRSGDARAAPVSRGLSPNSHFYEAHGSFHLFNTCNTWTANRLRSAGVNLSPSGIVTAGDLMSRLREALASKAPRPHEPGSPRSP